jgi:hypothetical protein
MKRVLCLILMVSLYTCVYANIRRINELHLFHVEPIDTLATRYQQMIVNKIDSLQKDESIEPFFGGTEIEKIYQFDDLPNILLFEVEDGRINYPFYVPHYRFLFNTIDSSIYPFDGNSVRFSKIIKNDLPLIIQRGDSALKELVYLYLNTLGSGADYYIISNAYNFLNIWENASKMRYVRRHTLSESEIKEESRKVMKQIWEFESIRNKDYYEVNACSWYEEGGTVELWRFRVSNSIFELYEHRILFHNVGPYF